MSTTELLSIGMQLGLNGRVRAVPFMIRGGSGIAKTEFISQLAQKIAAKRNIQFPAEIWSGPQLQAEDAGGLPVPDMETRTTHLFPIRVGSTLLKAGQGVLCIDEFGSISEAQEAAFLNLIQGGKLGERVLPESIARFAIGNNSDIASNGRDLSLPAANRFAWVEWELAVHDWVDYMRGGEGVTSNALVLPDTWDEHIPWAKALISSYISRNPTQMYAPPTNIHDVGAWPSPRSWENAAFLLAACRAVGDTKPQNELSISAIQACVGLGATEAFVAWLVEANLPDPEVLLADPEEALRSLPERNDHLGVTCEAVAIAALQDRVNGKPADKVDRWTRAWKIIGPVFTEKSDAALNAARLLAQRIPRGVKSFGPEAKKVSKILRDSGLL